MQKRAYFHGKRGFTHDIFFNAFELVLAAIILIALFSFVNDAAKQTLFEKNYAARDISLLVNTVYAAPGNVEYNYYEKSVQGFVINFKANKVEIGNENAPIFYYFGQDSLYSFHETSATLDEGGIAIEKTDSSIEIK